MNFEFWQKRSQGISLENIESIEEKLGAKLPGAYKLMLKETNGGAPNPSIVIAENGMTIEVREFYGLGSSSNTVDLMIIERIHFVEIPSGFLPVGQDFFGNHLVMSLVPKTYGTVFWKDHEELTPTKGLIKIANGFDELIDNMKFKISDDDLFEIIAKEESVDDILTFLNKYNGVKNKSGRTLVQEIARHGRLDLLKICASQGFSMEGALHLAAMNGHMNVVRYLVEGVGMDPFAKDLKGRTPAMCAFLDLEVREYLNSRDKQ